MKRVWNPINVTQGLNAVKYNTTILGHFTVELTLVALWWVKEIHLGWSNHKTRGVYIHNIGECEYIDYYVEPQDYYANFN